MLTSLLLISLGFGLLVVGGEILVRGAVGLAERLRLSTFVISAVIIGFGSSMPELVTSIEAGLLGSPGIALGNIVGSNIINILVVIGIAALITPVALTGQYVRLDTIIVCAITAAFVALCAVLELSPAIGAVLLAALTAYLIYSVRREFDTGAQEAGAETSETSTDLSVPVLGNGWVAGTASVLVGLLLLIAGGHLVVGAAITLAKLVGMNEAIIGLTVVAFGTSLPEIVTAVIAAIRRHADVALGNVLGSCVFNLLAIGGTIAIVSPTGMPDELARFDTIVMLAAAFTLLLTVFLVRRINRPIGALFLGGYAAYLMVLWP